MNDDPGNECRLWWARPRDVTPRARQLLNEVERSRAARYRREVDRARFVVGCALSRLVLATELGMPPERVPLRRDCEECGAPHGRPRVPGRWLSVSHAGDWVVVAVTGIGPVGVDVERYRAEADTALRSVLSAAELAATDALPMDDRLAALTRLWTRKEAAVKATGEGLRAGLSRVEVSAPDAPARLLRYPGAAPRLWLEDVAVDSDHTAALAVATAHRPPVSDQDGGALLRSAD